ncbi:hypothetical protein KY285_010891 [Solanum tuberosum]|nr:hypothetical protein KY289_011467 [Solanum tuberosum]KAH0735184.1 hypothetical protein KY285_010891 [Solanum tuberosum]
MKAIAETLKYCVSKEVRSLVIESNSLLMVNITNKTWRVPWELAEQYDELQQALMKIEAIIQHTFREGNKMADYMANLAIDNDEKQIFRSFQQLPPFGKKDNKHRESSNSFVTNSYQKDTK